MKRFNIKSLLFITTFLLASSAKLYSAGGEAEPLKVDWSFKGITGKFDRASLQRGFQVYKEVCSSCHSMQYLSYRNLGEPGGPEFSEQEVKARPGGSNYIYSVLVGYEDPPAGVTLDDGVYYNKYMIGNKIKMSSPLSDDIIEYSDGTQATVDQMAKDVTTFLSWAAEPELEERHRTGVKVIIYLILLTTLVYLSMKKIWSRVDTEV